jgi:hypothetical protein
MVDRNEKRVMTGFRGLLIDVLEVVFTGSGDRCLKTRLHNILEMSRET